MYKKPESKNKGYNVYVEHSIPEGEPAHVLTLQLREIITNTEDSQKPKIIPYCVQEKASTEHDQYLNEFIKDNTDLHVYVMVPGTNVFSMIYDITQSAKTATKVFVLILNESAMEIAESVGRWTEQERVALMALKQRMVKDSDNIVVVTDFTKLAAAITVTINEGTAQPIYRSAAKEHAVTHAAESILKSAT